MRSGRPELLPAVHRVCRTWKLWGSRGYVSRAGVAGDDRSVGREWRMGMRVLVDGGVVIMSKQTMRQAARLAASQAQAARVRADRDRRLEKLVVV